MISGDRGGRALLSSVIWGVDVDGMDVTVMVGEVMDGVTQLASNAIISKTKLASLRLLGFERISMFIDSSCFHII